MAALVFWLIKRNRKDEKEWEKEVIQSELKPDVHDNDEPGLKINNFVICKAD